MHHSPTVSPNTQIYVLFLSGGEGTRTPEPLDCQSSALPAELRPHEVLLFRYLLCIVSSVVIGRFWLPSNRTRTRSTILGEVQLPSRMALNRQPSVSSFGVRRAP